MTAPMVRGTARRLGLRRPLRPGEYRAPDILDDDPAARIRAATGGWAVTVAEATQGAAEFCAALRRGGAR